ncbi:MAG TPA: SAM-dependent methyltransferase [Herpetosiphonaceae bacterium]
MKRGSLAIVGTGITLMSQLTAEAQARIASADQVFFLVPHALAEQWLRSLNPRAESLAGFYRSQRDRLDVYRAITEHILDAVRAGSSVCAAFYGHPSVFVTPTRDLVRQGRAEGYAVTVLPGISAEDCLFADLDLDPGERGCQSYEATDFLLRPRRFDPSTPLILWQVGVIGHRTVVDATLNPAKGLAILEARLRQCYPAEHRVTIYEAPGLPTQDPVIVKLSLDQLPHAPVTAVSTLYVPPLAPPPIDAQILEQLGVSDEL